MLQLEAEIVDHRQCPEARRVAGGAEIAIDVVLCEAGVLDRTPGRLGVELRDGLVRLKPRRVLVNADDIVLAFDAHRGPILPMAHSLRARLCARGAGCGSVPPWVNPGSTAGPLNQSASSVGLI